MTEQALKDAKAVVVLWSKHSVDSDWVRAEATQADRYGTLVPVTIEPCNRPIMFELTHTADLSGWNGDVTAAPLARIHRRIATHSRQSRASIADYGGACWQRCNCVAAHSRPCASLDYCRRGRSPGCGPLLALPGPRIEEPAAAASPATTPATLASIAVLPFKDMSQNKDQEYFADGVTEEILNTLASLKDLKVTARTSAFAFKGKDVDLRTVGQTLGVQHILEGSIRKDGETLRITAQLIDTKSDAHVWSKTYDRPLKDIFKVQEEIARSVAESLQVALGVGFGNQPGMTRDVEAYDAYLQALALWPLWTADSRRRAIELLQQAVDRDREFATAWRVMADYLREHAQSRRWRPRCKRCSRMVEQIGSRFCPVRTPQGRYTGALPGHGHAQSESRTLRGGRQTTQASRRNLGDAGTWMGGDDKRRRFAVESRSAPRGRCRT